VDIPRKAVLSGGDGLYVAYVSGVGSSGSGVPNGSAPSAAVPQPTIGGD
jgi:hypothetical protein